MPIDFLNEQTKGMFIHQWFELSGSRRQSCFAIRRSRYNKMNPKFKRFFIKSTEEIYVEPGSDDADDNLTSLPKEVKTKEEQFGFDVSKFSNVSEYIRVFLQPYISQIHIDSFNEKTNGILIHQWFKCPAEKCKNYYLPTQLHNMITHIVEEWDGKSHNAHTYSHWWIDDETLDMSYVKSCFAIRKDLYNKMNPKFRRFMFTPQESSDFRRVFLKPYVTQGFIDSFNKKANFTYFNRTYTLKNILYSKLKYNITAQ